MHDDPDDWPPQDAPEPPAPTGLEHAIATEHAVPWSTEPDPDAIAAADDLAEELRLKGVDPSDIHAQTRFLSALARIPSEALARKAAGATRRDVTRWRENAAFRQAERTAQRDAADLLLASAWQRATEGTLTPVFQSGRLIGHKRVLSERLHELLLKGLMPQLFDRGEIDPKATHQTIVLQSPEAVRDAVRRLSPTTARRTPLADATGKAHPPRHDAPR